MSLSLRFRSVIFDMCRFRFAFAFNIFLSLYVAFSLSLRANLKRNFSLRRFFRFRLERNLSENFTMDGSSLPLGAKSKRFSKVFTLEVFKKCPGTDQTGPKSYSAGF